MGCTILKQYQSSYWCHWPSSDGIMVPQVKIFVFGLHHSEIVPIKLLAPLGYIILKQYQLSYWHHWATPFWNSTNQVTGTIFRGNSQREIIRTQVLHFLHKRYTLYLHTHTQTFLIITIFQSWFTVNISQL